jgi:MinD-like ATPase involved in chromosome partitioning or flagellar assembly
VELPTYTSIWRIEKRLYKLYDFRLPMPLPVGQIAVFAAITVPYIIMLQVFGLPFNHSLFWLYVLPPGVLTWLATRPVLESKRLPELILSQLRYLGEPSVWCRMAPLAEKDEITVVGRVWRRTRPIALDGADQQRKARTVRARLRSLLRSRGASRGLVREVQPAAGAAAEQAPAQQAAAQQITAQQITGEQVTTRRPAAPVAAWAEEAEARRQSQRAADRAGAQHGQRAAEAPAPWQPQRITEPARSAHGHRATEPAASQVRRTTETAAPLTHSATGAAVPQGRRVPEPGAPATRRTPGPATPLIHRAAEPTARQAQAAVPAAPARGQRNTEQPLRPDLAAQAAPQQAPARHAAPQQAPARHAAPQQAAPQQAAAQQGAPQQAVPQQAAAQQAEQAAALVSPPRPAPDVVVVPADRSVADSAPTVRPAPAVERALSGPGEHRSGWRSHVSIVPGGRGPGRPDQQKRAKERAVLPVDGARLVVVLGCTVGAGQTVTTLMLADLLASLREEPVAALDLNPGPASLTELARVPATNVSDLLAGRAPAGPQPHRGGRVGRGRGRADSNGGRGRGRLDVICDDVAAPDGGAARAIQHGRLLDVLSSRYSLTLADPGAPTVAKLLAAADQLVLVAPSSPDASRALGMTLEWLGAHGYHPLSEHAITVINGVSQRSSPHADQAVAVVSGRCRAIVRVPWDDHLADPETERGIRESLAMPGASRLRQLRPAVQQAYTALAGVLVKELAAGPQERRAAP